jgi:hypothetical protein
MNTARSPIEVGADLIPAEIAAERLGKSPSWLRRQIAAGRIGCTRVGQTVYLTDRDIAAYLAGNRSEATPPAGLALPTAQRAPGAGRHAGGRGRRRITGT